MVLETRVVACRAGSLQLFGAKEAKGNLRVVCKSFADSRYLPADAGDIPSRTCRHKL
ncbi:hypothetical protein COMA2_80099 [Candidatus Nitrospira nitrificans]|uniref:Uncharacterized protein n=1 Tax=Candidatus Nitrospira nitrificans TaxID=1742973 RepID=A0A0S4LQ00_9BACT|nr:hypothetical protein COMA2_80099 [Candidatus Nitrospira nitrificans]